MEKNMLICSYCNKEFKNKGGQATHEPYCKSNPNKQVRERNWKAGVKKGNVPWNKGLTKDDHPGVERPTLVGKRFGASVNGHTDKTKNKLSKIAKIRKIGGYIQGSGRGKKGWYKGFFCDSSWELAYVIYCLDHNKNILRNKEKREYTFNDEIKNYIPDFIVDGQLIEIKGYKTKQWEAKLKANPDIQVLYEEDLIDVLTYVKNKYGNNFIDLYE